MSECRYWQAGMCAFDGVLECGLLGSNDAPDGEDCYHVQRAEKDAALASLADLREVAEGLRDGLESCRSYLGNLVLSGLVAGHEMQIPSYEVTEPLAAYDAWKKNP